MGNVNRVYFDSLKVDINGVCFTVGTHSPRDTGKYSIPSYFFSDDGLRQDVQDVELNEYSLIFTKPCTSQIETNQDNGSDRANEPYQLHNFVSIFCLKFMSVVSLNSKN